MQRKFHSSCKPALSPSAISFAMRKCSRLALNCCPIPSRLTLSVTPTPAPTAACRLPATAVPLTLTNSTRRQKSDALLVALATGVLVRLQVMLPSSNLQGRAGEIRGLGSNQLGRAGENRGQK